MEVGNRAFPFILSIGTLIIFQTGWARSISAYYHTDMRNVFVGVLWVIGFFLLSYRGYELRDDVTGTLGCVFAVGVALFPTTPDGGVKNIIGYIHDFFTIAFFGTLIYYSLCLFTKTDPDKEPTKRKLQRNKVYKICGYVMIVCVVLIIVHTLLPVNVRKIFIPVKPVYWLETFAIWAFGVSWFTKGEAILKD